VKVSKIEIGELYLDLGRMSVIKKSSKEEEFFQARDFLVLKMLIEASPKAVSRDDILNRFWGEDQFPTHRTVDNSIVRIRQIIGDKEGTWIRSVRGVGYQWATARGEEE
ncbi:MAG: winged helix-turn-helix domain-containing protein, partial [Pseudobdellovibrionaceae bacterium]